MSNASFLTADRFTHLKIVVVALTISVAVSVVAIAAHVAPDQSSSSIKRAEPVVKAGHLRVISQSDATVIR